MDGVGGAFTISLSAGHVEVEESINHKCVPSNGDKGIRGYHDEGIWGITPMEADKRINHKRLSSRGKVQGSRESRVNSPTLIPMLPLLPL